MRSKVHLQAHQVYTSIPLMAALSSLPPRDTVDDGKEDSRLNTTVRPLLDGSWPLPTNGLARSSIGPYV